MPIPRYGRPPGTSTKDATLRGKDSGILARHNAPGKEQMHFRFGSRTEGPSLAESNRTRWARPLSRKIHCPIQQNVGANVVVRRTSRQLTTPRPLLLTKTLFTALSKRRQNAKALLSGLMNNRLSHTCCTLNRLTIIFVASLSKRQLVVSYVEIQRRNCSNLKQP